MAPSELPAGCRTLNGGRGGGGGVSKRRVERVPPPAIQETSEEDWIRLNQHLHATFGNKSGEEIRANFAPTIIEETLVQLREVFGQFSICALAWITKLHGQTAGDERPAPNVGESRPHSEEESHLGEQQRARTEKRTKRHAEAGPRFEDETLAKQRAEDETRAKEQGSRSGEQQRARNERRTKLHAEAVSRSEDEPRAKQRAEDEPRAKQRAEDEPRAKQRAEDETRAKQRAETESRAKQAASSPDEEDEENEEHSSSRKKAKYDRNCWYVVCATMIIVMRVLR